MMRLEADRVGAIRNVRRRRQVYAAIQQEARPLLAQHDGVQWRIGKRRCRNQISGLTEHLDRRTELCDPPFGERRRVAAQQQRFMRLGGCINEDRAGLGEKLWQLGTQFFAQLIVQIGERFVEQHQAGVLDDGAGQRRALLLPAGEIERRTLQIRRKL